MGRKSATHLFERAREVIPGGVNSPVRSFRAVGGTPIYVQRACGSKLTTVEGRELIDLCGSWGPLILGHAHPAVVEAIQQAAARGTTFGTNTEREVLFAEMLCEQIPSMEQVRLVSSGTEATMTALRLARGVTGRDKILKFDGCYHGHSDALLVSAGSGLLTGGQASSAGVAREVAADTLVAPYNDLQAARQLVTAHREQVAAIIIEPIAGNMGLIEPGSGYLRGLRELADRSGAVLIFDEVITGFRLAPTTYGTLCGVEPDLTCLGKIIGGGLPIGAVGGKRSVMECLAPDGPVYQAGTLSGNPIALAAGIATLERLIEEQPYEMIAARATMLVEGLVDLATSLGRELSVASIGGMFTPFFQTGTPTNLTEAKQSDAVGHAAFFHAMLERGIYLPPSPFEVSFVSAAHTQEDIAAILQAAGQALAVNASP